MNISTNQISSKILKGAGTVEQIIARLMNQSILMKINFEEPQKLNLFLPVTVVPDLTEVEIKILEQSAKTKRNVVKENDIIETRSTLENETSRISRSKMNDGTFFLTVDANHFQITFWIGFSNINEAQTTRLKMNL